MNRPTTPSLEPRNDENCEHPTPNKAAVQGTTAYLESVGIKGHEDAGYGIEYSIIPIPLVDTIINLLRKIAVGKKVITKDQIRETEKILETDGLAGRALTWEQLGLEAGVDASGRTVQTDNGHNGLSQVHCLQKGLGE
ncbi:MAG: hypothetical protein M1816_004691 [Peltula sp. TS41687]|nr:MAG: hypothetical protein M1816_004691 [Peltula sp. TS41687]